MNKKGFTLIELMIVVAVIGILASIIIPNFLKFQDKAKKENRKVNGIKITCLHPATGDQLYTGCAIGNIKGDKSTGYTFEELKSGKKITANGICTIKEDHKECYITKGKRKR